MTNGVEVTCLGAMVMALRSHATVCVVVDLVLAWRYLDALEHGAELGQGVSDFSLLFVHIC